MVRLPYLLAIVAVAATALRPDAATAQVDTSDPWYQLGRAIGQEIQAEARQQQLEQRQQQQWQQQQRQQQQWQRQQQWQQQQSWNGDQRYRQNPYPQTYRVVPQATYGTVATPAPPVVSSAPAVATNTLPYKGPGVKLVLPASEGGSVTFLLDRKDRVVIEAGQEKMLSQKGMYEISFSRGVAEGRNFGDARYTITEGTYHFTVTDKGWELMRQKDAVTARPTEDRSASGLIKTTPLAPAGR